EDQRKAGLAEQEGQSRAKARDGARKAQLERARHTACPPSFSPRPYLAALLACRGTAARRALRGRAPCGLAASRGLAAAALGGGALRRGALGGLPLRRAALRGRLPSRRRALRGGLPSTARCRLATSRFATAAAGR